MILAYIWKSVKIFLEMPPIEILEFLHEPQKGSKPEKQIVSGFGWEKHTSFWSGSVHVYWQHSFKHSSVTRPKDENAFGSSLV